MAHAVPPEHSILWLVSRATGRSFPTAVFTGDTDMVTMGWVSLTSTESPEVVMTQCQGSELSDPASVEARANRELARRDLRYVPIVRSADNGRELKGLPFSEFRRLYRPPVIYYRDIYSDGEAMPRGEMAPAEFRQAGGRVSLLMPGPALVQL